MPPTLLCLVGPTGSGKTEVALQLCALLGGEIVSADSVQLYRGLNIGSAKPTRAEQARARHHLIDIREPHETYSAALWAHDARATIAEITARGKVPIVVGGTGFYLRALLQPNLIPAAPPDEKLREELAREYSQRGADFVFQKLRDLDANAAARLHPNDRHRVIRAIEVALSDSRSDARVLARAAENAARDFRGDETHSEEATISDAQNASTRIVGERGAISDDEKSFSEATVSERETASTRGAIFGGKTSSEDDTIFDTETASTRSVISDDESEFAPLIFGLQWQREELYARLEKRIDAMLQNGFMEELRGLLESGVSPDAPALQSVGYKQMQPSLRDETLFAECVELWKRDTRRYAKRQMTWFRHQLPTRWIETNEESGAAKIAEEIAREYSREIAP